MQSKDVVAAMITLLTYEPMSLYASMELSNVSDWDDDNLKALKNLLSSKDGFVQSSIVSIISGSEAVYEKFATSILEKINFYPQELQEQLIGLYFCKEQITISNESQVELVKFIESLTPNQKIGTMYSVNDLYGIIHSIQGPVPEAIAIVKKNIRSISDDNVLYSSINFLSQHKQIDEKVCEFLKGLVKNKSTDYFVSMTAREALRAHGLLSGEDAEDYNISPPAPSMVLDSTDGLSANFLEASDDERNKIAS